MFQQRYANLGVFTTVLSQLFPLFFPHFLYLFPILLNHQIQKIFGCFYLQQQKNQGCQQMVVNYYLIQCRCIVKVFNMFSKKTGYSRRQERENFETALMGQNQFSVNFLPKHVWEDDFLVFLDPNLILILTILVTKYQSSYRQHIKKIFNYMNSNTNMRFLGIDDR